MKVRLSEQSLEFLRDLITGDKKVTDYRSGPGLVSFFRRLGFDDTYERGFPSRWFYTQEKLREINGSQKMEFCIQKTLDPRNFIEQSEHLENIIKKFNAYLEFDNYKVERVNKRIFIRKLEPSIAPFKTTVDNEFIEEELHKVETKLENGDYEGTITSSRTLLETVLLFIHQEITGMNVNFDGDMKKLFKSVRKLLNMELEQDAEECILEITRGFTSVVSGLAGLRNKTSDAHGRISKKYKPMRHHALLAVNSSRTLTNFLLDSFNHQKNANKNH